MKKIVISTLIAAMVTSSLFSVSAAAYDGVETFDHCEIYSSTEIKASLRYASGDRWYDNGSLTLNSPTDVKLSLHSVDYAVSAVKEGSTWNIYIGFSDKYDYACIENAEEAGVNELIAFANNYAYSAQQLGSIVPYNILAYMRETY